MSTDLFFEDYLTKSRFSNGEYCAKCSHIGKIYKIKSNSSYQMYKCPACNQRFSIITNTIFEKSNIGLSKWFLAYYLVIKSSKKISIIQLAHKLEVTQKTASSIVQRLSNLHSDPFLKNTLETYFLSFDSQSVNNKSSLWFDKINDIFYGTIYKKHTDTIENTFQNISIRVYIYFSRYNMEMINNILLVLFEE